MALQDAHINTGDHYPEAAAAWPDGAVCLKQASSVVFHRQQQVKFMQNLQIFGIRDGGMA